MDEQQLPDLLRLRGSVVTASDEFFAAKENLIRPDAPVFVPETYDAKGQVDPGPWREIVPRALLTGDARHAFKVSAGRRYSHVRLNIFPDGGVARLRLYGSLAEDGLAAVRQRWAETA